MPWILRETVVYHFLPLFGYFWVFEKIRWFSYFGVSTVKSKLFSIEARKIILTVLNAKQSTKTLIKNLFNSFYCSSHSIDIPSTNSVIYVATRLLSYRFLFVILIFHKFYQFALAMSGMIGHNLAELLILYLFCM